MNTMTGYFKAVQKVCPVAGQHINLQGSCEFQKQPDPLNIDTIIHELTRTLADRQVTQFSLSVYIAILAFGPLMFTKSLHYLPAATAWMNSCFCLGNIGALIAVGIISDRLRSRRALSFLGAEPTG
jgi:hypothetical protein